jgi:WD40 repeat protein
MAVVQRISIQHYTRCDVLGFSPNGKTLIIAFDRREIHYFEAHDLNIRTRLARKEHTAAWAVAFDPRSQFLASAGRNQDVQIWTL